MTAPRAAGGLMTRPLTRPQLALSEAEGATLSRRERDLGWLRAPHPAFGHPLPEGEGSRRRVDPETILLPSGGGVGVGDAPFIEILLPPGEGARRADEGRAINGSAARSAVIQLGVN